uniref:hypothetical protein n=1 Tax=Gormaniella terricola TaxID=2904618 RepID=UPI0021CCB938|nr:hypothetical protein ODF01_mgp16 [Gormaniella terricola]UWV18312.1 hypothetical protein [Gormaniella terricola]
MSDQTDLTSVPVFLQHQNVHLLFIFFLIIYRTYIVGCMKKCFVSTPVLGTNQVQSSLSTGFYAKVVRSTLTKCKARYPLANRLVPPFLLLYFLVVSKLANPSLR